MSTFLLLVTGVVWSLKLIIQKPFVNRHLMKEKQEQEFLTCHRGKCQPTRRVKNVRTQPWIKQIRKRLSGVLFAHFRRAKDNFIGLLWPSQQLVILQWSYRVVRSLRTAAVVESWVEADPQWPPQSSEGRYQWRCRCGPEPNPGRPAPSAGSHPLHRTSAHRCAPPQSQTWPHISAHFRGGNNREIIRVRCYWTCVYMMCDVKALPDWCSWRLRFPFRQRFWRICLIGEDEILEFTESLTIALKPHVGFGLVLQNGYNSPGIWHNWWERNQ